MRTTVVCSLVLVLAAASAISAEPGKGTASPKLEAKLVPGGSSGQFMIDIFSDQPLVEPKLQYVIGDWEQFYDSVREGDKFWYRAKRYYSPSADTLITLQSLSADKKMDFTANFAIRQAALSSKQPSTLEASGTVECGDPNAPERRDLGLAIINRLRALRGLAPIQYDAEFQRVSRVNNEMGGRHRYNTGWQTWAPVCEPEGAVSMWMQYYSSHGKIIMDPNITRGGTHTHPNYGTTFTGR